jgi:hypothetical protein
MLTVSPRRRFLKMASAVFPISMFGSPSRMLSLSLPENGAPSPDMPVAEQFPMHPPELVRDVVILSHFDLNRVKEIVEARPSLARAAWDWGFGDWEDALGAASHTGNRAIAEYLISKGARPSLFSSTMLGHLDIVKAFLAAHPGVERTRGPHSITLLAHAQAGGEAARPVFEYLQTLGDSGKDPVIPLSDSDANAIKGTYVFGPSVSEEVDVTIERGMVLWTRRGKFGRPLTHLGSRVFYPAGASAVRIHFVEDGAAMLMTVEDPNVVLTARRKAGAPS